MEATQTLDLRGTLRAVSPEETLRKIQPLIKKANITRLVNFTNLDSIGIPVYSCIRPLSKNLSTSQGKGITPLLAQCSAYMEAIESFFAEEAPTDVYLEHPRLKQSPEEIDLSMLHPGTLFSHSMRDRIHEWTYVKNLSSLDRILIPTHYIKFDLSLPQLENAFFRKTTTGLASGNTEEEATLHSLFEIIERNAKHRFDQLSPQEKHEQLIDLKTIDYPEAKFLLERLAENHIDILVFELANPFGYPSFFCFIGDQNPLRKLGTYGGAGTHAHPGIALCRAITEAVQSRLTYIAGSRDDISPHEYQLQWFPLHFQGKRNFQAITSQGSLSLASQYPAVIEAIEREGFSIYAHTHTSKNDPISVVKCLVPGLAI